MGLERLFQAILSFCFELMGENILYIIFIPTLERETQSPFWFSSGVLALSDAITELN